MTTFSALNKFVAIEMRDVNQKKTTEHGIIYEEKGRNLIETGVVVSVGSAIKEPGIAEGDVVLFPFTKVKDKYGDNVYLIEYDEIMAVVTE